MSVVPWHRIAAHPGIAGAGCAAGAESLAGV